MGRSSKLEFMLDSILKDKRTGDLRGEELAVQHYITEFTAMAEMLAHLKLADCPSCVQQRIKQVEELTEEYFQVVGEYPKSKVLDNLGSYLLVEYLRDNHVDKVTNTEYPILSDKQLKRRARKQILMPDDTVEFLNNKYNRELAGLNRKQVKNADY